MPRTYFDELGIGLGWKAETVIAMLWLYLDESGEHSADGNLKRLTFGGGVAPFEAWQELSLEWAAILERYGIAMFHMSDFEARQRDFKDWPEDRRRDLLNALLDTMLRFVPIYWGVVDEPFSGSEERTFRAHYENNLAKTTKDLWVASSTSGQPITMVFARHNQYSATKIARYFDLWNEADRLIFGGINDPAKLCPLQVADIVAYEFSRAARDKQPETMRYPLRRIKDEATSCSLVYARTLARVF